MGKAKTKPCPSCFEIVLFKAIRCKSCGASLSIPKKTYKKYFARFLYLFVIAILVLNIYLLNSISQRNNEISELNQRIEKLEKSLAKVYGLEDDNLKAEENNISEGN